MTRRKRAIIGLLGLAIASYVGVTSLASSAPADIEEKRAEAELVVSQIQDLDGRLGLAIEDYNGATLRLERLDESLDSTGARLDIARKSSRVAQRRLQERLRAIYMGNDATSLEVILGSTSVEQLMDRVSTVERVSSRDRAIVESARGARVETSQRERKLREARQSQADVVAELDGQRRDIERLLTERENLALSIEDELTRLVAEEARRQEELKAETERRLAAERAERRSIAQTAAETPRSASAPQAEASPAPSSSPAPAAAPPPAPPPPAAKYTGVVATAMKFLGVPYVWGGESPSGGFDCSGFVLYVYRQHGVSLPHHAATQFNYGTPVTRSQLQPGDIVFFNGLGHNGIYIGDDKFVHAPHTGDVVKISSLNDSWYTATWVGARRL
ncbi:MAG: NlpC/P60 family protein [Gaiellaceae bacterium]